MKPVAAYVRMSTDQQKYSISNQLAAIEAHCEQMGYVIERVFADPGRSGLTLKDRPGLGALVSAARRGRLPFDAVIVLDVSRFGRFQDEDEGAYYEQLLKRAGAPVIYCGEAFTREVGAVAAIFKALKRAMAAEFSRDLSVKIEASMRRRAEAGHWCSSRPGYGYRRVAVTEDGRRHVLAGTKSHTRFVAANYTLCLGPCEEVAAVRRLFALYIERAMPLSQLAAQLAAEGWPRPAGRGWCWERVGLILRNEKYAGVLLFGLTRRILKGPKYRPEPATHVRIVDAFPPIVSPQTFAAAQRRMRQTARRTFTHEQIIGRLGDLFRQRGVITKAMIVADPKLPCVESIQKMFGSLASAFEGAGLPAWSPTQVRVAARRYDRRLPALGTS